MSRTPLFTIFVAESPASQNWFVEKVLLLALNSKLVTVENNDLNYHINADNLRSIMLIVDDGFQHLYFMRPSLILRGLG